MFRVISGSTIALDSLEFDVMVLFSQIPPTSCESFADTAPQRSSAKTIVVTSKIACFLIFSPPFCLFEHN